MPTGYYDNSAWYSWTTQTSSSSTTNYSTTARDIYNGTGGYDTSATWNSWTQSYGSYNPEPVRFTSNSRIQHSIDPVRAEKARRDQNYIRALRRDSQRQEKAAEVKAALLLMEHLTDEQCQEILEHNRFTITADDGRVFEIRTDTHVQNVYQLDRYDYAEGVRKIITRWCAHFPDYGSYAVPLGDMLLGQKLALEHHPETFFRVANRIQSYDFERAAA